MSVLLLWTLAGCVSTEAPDVPLDGGVSGVASPVRFVVLGDAGTGDDNQLAVAKSMETVCAQRGCDFVVGVGDNIYEVGVTSAYDPQFDLKFEQPYAGLDMPFYMSLGNHDNGGTRGLHASGDLQVDYAARSDRPTDRWHMPGRWYSHEHGTNTTLQFLALDTNIVWSSNAEVPAAAYLLSADVDAIRQTEFLKDSFASSQPDWRFTHGHHPLHSDGDHGDEPAPTGDWLQQVICDTGHVDVAFFGHDHDLQWLQAKPDTCGTTQFIVSGAGAKTRAIARDNHDALFKQGDTLGFFWAQVEGDTFTGAFYGVDAQLLFEHSFTRS